MQSKPITSCLIPRQHGEQTVIFASTLAVYIFGDCYCTSTWFPSFLTRAVQLLSGWSDTPWRLPQKGLHAVGAIGSRPHQTTGNLSPSAATLGTWPLPSTFTALGSGHWTHRCFLPTDALCMEVHRNSCPRPTFRSLVSGPSIVSCCIGTPCHGLPKN